MAWFKNELLNRENNFNKMFNANPNIGVVDPTELIKVIQIKIIYRFIEVVYKKTIHRTTENLYLINKKLSIRTIMLSTKKLR